MTPAHRAALAEQARHVRFSAPWREATNRITLLLAEERGEKLELMERER